MNKKHLYLLAGSLTVIGLFLFFYKALVMEFPLVPGVKTYIWNIESHLTFEADNKPIKVSMFVPRNSNRFTIMHENFVSKGYGVSVSTEKSNRRVHWSIRTARGTQSLYYRATVIRLNRERLPYKSASLKQELPILEGAFLEASKTLMTEVREKSADTDSLVAELFKRLNNPAPGDVSTLLLGQKTTAQKKIDLAVQLLTSTGIPARATHGIRLEEQKREAQVLHWLEVYEQGNWISYDPETGARDIPEDYLVWWRGMEELVKAQGVKKLEMSLSVARSEEATLQLAVEKGIIKEPILLDFSLFRLPVQTQAVYRVVLLVPIGVFFLVILRNVIGLRTFGTFMPVLIALSFRETQLLWGILLFIVLIGIGLLIRLYLEHLKLLVVPRLAAILIIVIGLMAVISILTHKLDLERGISVALFPMVIVSMTIERMSIVWEELGALDAIKQGIGSLVAATFAYLLMSIKYFEHLVFVFPEILLILLSATLLLGRYSGFRLLEFNRFKALTNIKSDV